MEEFRALRQRLAAGDAASAAPLQYLPPFLEVVRSVDTSGPITGAALAALDNLLRGGLVRPDGDDAAAAVHAIVGAVTHCRFEATDPDSDEAVLARILHVLLQCLKAPAGRLLSDDAVCSAVQTCYRIGHQTGKKGGLLRQTARHILHEAVRELFSHLPDILDSGTGSSNDDAGGNTETAAGGGWRRGSGRPWKRSGCGREGRGRPWDGGAACPTGARSAPTSVRGGLSERHHALSRLADRRSRGGARY